MDVEASRKVGESDSAGEGAAPTTGSGSEQLLMVGVWRGVERGGAAEHTHEHATSSTLGEGHRSGSVCRSLELILLRTDLFSLSFQNLRFCLLLDLSHLQSLLLAYLGTVL